MTRGCVITLMLALLPCVPGCTPVDGDNTHGHADGGHEDDGGLDDQARITTIAGTGIGGYAGDGASAVAAQFDNPVAVVMTEAGEILIADFGNRRVRSIDPETGIVSTVAGTGEPTGEDALAQPAGLAVADDDGFYVSDWGGHRVLRYFGDSSHLLVVGTGIAGCIDNNDIDDALTADIHFPRSVGLLADGSVIFGEQGCHRIRRVSADGTLETYAGTGQAGYGGDDGPAIDATFSALEAELDGPNFGFGLSPEDPPDELFVADTANNVIREINLFTGRVETLAGTGDVGFDDGPLDEATFNRPTAVFASSDHAVWIVDSGNHAIRRIDPLGTEVSTVVGTGQPGFNGDDIPAAEALLNDPRGLFVSDDVDLLFIADSGNHRIRLVRLHGAAR